MAKTTDIDVTRMPETEATRTMENMLKIAGLTTSADASHSVARAAYEQGCREERERIAGFLEKKAATLVKENAMHPAIILRIAANLVRTEGKAER